MRGGFRVAVERPGDEDVERHKRVCEALRSVTPFVEHEGQRPIDRSPIGVLLEPERDLAKTIGSVESKPDLKGNREGLRHKADGRSHNWLSRGSHLFSLCRSRSIECIRNL